MGGGPERPIELTDAEAADMSKPDFRQAAQAGRPGRSSHGSSDKAKPDTVLQTNKFLLARLFRT